jgi:hypothetical protein
VKPWLLQWRKAEKCECNKGAEDSEEKGRNKGAEDSDEDKVYMKIVELEEI